LYQLLSQPGAIPAGVVIRLGRSVRVSRSRLFDWIGQPDFHGNRPQEEEDLEFKIDQLFKELG
jgi:hypothetical protein